MVLCLGGGILSVYDIWYMKKSNVNLIEYTRVKRMIHIMMQMILELRFSCVSNVCKWLQIVNYRTHK